MFFSKLVIALALAVTVLALPTPEVQLEKNFKRTGQSISIGLLTDPVID